MLGFSPVGTAPISGVGVNVVIITYDAGVPVSAITRLFSDVNTPTDIGGSVSSITAVPVEISQHTFVLSGDSSNALEWLTTARRDGVVPAWLRYIVIPLQMPRGAVALIPADTNAIAVLAPRNAIRILLDANAILIPLEPSA